MPFIKEESTAYSSTISADVQQQLVSKMNHQAAMLATQGQYVKAISILQQAIALAPRYAPSHNNLGAIYAMCEMPNEAAQAYENALALDPQSAKSHFNLANIYRKLNKKQLAIKHLKKTLALEPNHHSATHILAATEGRNTQRAPNEYIKQLFDQYAPSFDATLTQALNYDTPNVLKNMFNQHVGGSINLGLDLGCGTGLSGAAFKPHCERLIGVDLSPAMLEKAKQKSVYAELHCAEMLSFLNSTPDKFDLFIAADSLIYAGGLHPLFATIRAKSNAQAFFLFSTENYLSNKKSDYQLTETGRYAHSLSYISQLLTTCKFELRAVQNTVIRKDVGQDILGNVFLAQAI